MANFFVQSASVMDMQRAVTWMKPYGCALAKGVAEYVTVFTTPVDGNVNIARAAFTETQSDPRLNRIRAHVRHSQTHAHTLLTFGHFKQTLLYVDE